MNFVRFKYILKKYLILFVLAGLMVFSAIFHHSVYLTDAITGARVPDIHVKISTWRVVFEPFLGPLTFLLRGHEALIEYLILFIWILAILMILLLETSGAQAQIVPGKVKASLLDITEDSKAEISVLVSDNTFAFGVSLLNDWLVPQTSILVNDGAVAENFVGQISQFTDGSNVWEISPTANGADSIRAQWSTQSDSGSWNNISAYAADFTIAANVASGDSIVFWFRIQTPVSTSSYNQHSSAFTVTALQF